MPANTFNGSVFTTSYSYGLNGKEYVFSCKGRPFAALVSPNLPTPTSSLLDYDLVKKLGLPMTDIQCRKFHFGGHRMRILGRVSTAVQCIKDGRINGNYHIKGLVISDLYQMLDTHCVAGARLQEGLAHLTDIAGSEESDEELNNGLDGSFTTTPMVSSSLPTAAVMSSPSTTAVMKSSPSTTAAMKSSPSTTAAMKSSPSTTAAKKSPTLTLMSANTSPPSTPTRAASSAPMSPPNMALSPDMIESNRVRHVWLEEDRKRKEELQKLWNNKRAWNKLKERDPGYAWHLLKCLANVQDWPDWNSDLTDHREPSLDDHPSELRGKWLDFLEETNPECLCPCGFPHLDYKCRKPNHDKKKKHCKFCCDDPKMARYCS